MRVCREGLTRHPGYLSARVTLGRALLDLGQLDEARLELQFVASEAPENLAAVRGLAEIFHREGDAAAALEYFQRALALARHDPELEEIVQQLSRQAGAEAGPSSGLTFEEAHQELLSAADRLPLATAAEPATHGRGPGGRRDRAVRLRHPGRGPRHAGRAAAGRGRGARRNAAGVRASGPAGPAPIRSRHSKPSFDPQEAPASAIADEVAALAGELEEPTPRRRRRRSRGLNGSTTAANRQTPICRRDDDALAAPRLRRSPMSTDGGRDRRRWRPRPRGRSAVALRGPGGVDRAAGADRPRRSRNRRGPPPTSRPCRSPAAEETDPMEIPRGADDANDAGTRRDGRAARPSGAAARASGTRPAATTCSTTSRTG